MDLNKVLSSFGIETEPETPDQTQGDLMDHPEDHSGDLCENPDEPEKPSAESADFDFNDYLQGQIAYLNRIGASMTLTPPEVRKRTLTLEEKITAVMNEKNKDIFLTLVNQWTQAFAAYAPRGE